MKKSKKDGITERTAQLSDVLELKRLWVEIFEDTPEYVQIFLEDLLEYDKALILEADNKIVASAYLIPCKLKVDNIIFNMYYEYAVLTIPEYRGRGLGLRLQRFIKKTAEKDGIDAICLLPADKGLISFYEKSGFMPAFYESADASYSEVIYTKAYLDHFARLYASDVPFEPETVSDDVPGLILRLNKNIPEDLRSVMSVPTA